MPDPGEGSRLPRRSSLPRRSRRRWTVAFAVAACWVVLYGVAGSITAATVLLVLLAAFCGACVVAMKSLGINSSHPWVMQLASRPWRDGQDVLRLSLRHLREVFVVTPRGTLLAPNAVELRMNPRDYGSLTELMDTGLINSSAAEVYQEQVAASGASFAAPGPVEVRLISDPSVPAGRYRLQQCRVQQPWPQPGALSGSGLPPPGLPGALSGSGLPPPGVLSHPGVPQPGQPAPVQVPGAGPQPLWHQPGDPFPFAHDGHTRNGAAAAASAATATALPTMAERGPGTIPALRLVSGDRVAHTRTSGARAGRGAVELVLPGVPTVSREHARFTYSDGHWWVTNLGRNGLTLNGAAVSGEHLVRDGDSIRWGRGPDALVSRVEIG